MVILFLLFLLQFSVACACLGVNTEQQEQLAEQGWNKGGNATRARVQDTFTCCGFDDKIDKEHPPPTCEEQLMVNKKKAWDNLFLSKWFCSWIILVVFIRFQLKCCPDPNIEVDCECPKCMTKLRSTISYAFKLCGWIGLFFSFTEVSWDDVWKTSVWKRFKFDNKNRNVFDILLNEFNISGWFYTNLVHIFNCLYWSFSIIAT